MSKLTFDSRFVVHRADPNHSKAESSKADTRTLASWHQGALSSGTSMGPEISVLLSAGRLIKSLGQELSVLLSVRGLIKSDNTDMVSPQV